MAEIDLNDLIIKNDSLPDNWKMLLIDPVTGLPAQNMTIAKFVELVTSKQPEATKDVKGLMSGIAYASLMKFQGAWSNKNVNTLINNGIWLNGGGDDYSEIMGWGVLCVFSASNFYIAQMSISNNGVRFRFSSNSGQSWSNPFMLYTNNTLYAVEESSLTSPISESYHFTPPPRKLRAKLLRIRQFNRAICDFPGVGYRQPGWFNSS